MGKSVLKQLEINLSRWKNQVLPLESKVVYLGTFKSAASQQQVSSKSARVRLCHSLLFMMIYGDHVKWSLQQCWVN